MAWIKVPLVKSSEDTVFYMYYGNPTCGDQQNDIAEIWDEYRMVHHLEEATSLLRSDSTMFMLHASPVGGTTQIPGKIDGSNNFDGTDDYLDVTHAAGLVFTDEITIEGWFRFSNASTRQFGYCQYQGANDDIRLDFNNANKIYFGDLVGGSWAFIMECAFTRTANQWYHIAVTRTGNSWYCFVVGVVTDDSPKTEADGLTAHAGATMYIGAIGGTGYYLDGWLDELCLRYEFIDSRKWQKELLPELKDKKNRHAKLKELSLAVGKRLFPSIDFTGFKDADGLLIAEFARRNKL